MKKIFSIASALMLALGMGMTSCSNDLDEVQAPVEQQTELHKLHLSASAPQSSETRSYIEGVTGKDAIKITGWKDGDIIWGVYPVSEDRNTTCGFLKFTFNGTTKVFDSEETSVTNEQIKWFVTGDFDTDNATNNSYINYPTRPERESASFMLYLTNPLMNIDVAGNCSDIPMWGTASVVEDQLTTSMELASEMAFLCLHNNSTAPIDVKLGSYYNSRGTFQYITYYRCYFSFAPRNEDLYFRLELVEADGIAGDPVGTTIAAGEKAYLPLCRKSYTGCDLRVIVNDNTEAPFAVKDANDFVPGKVYKMIYE